MITIWQAGKGEFFEPITRMCGDRSRTGFPFTRWTRSPPSSTGSLEVLDARSFSEISKSTSDPEKPTGCSRMT